ncbi:hypothetical protein GCM10007160_37620 [Litchfieldella qijiaojingensis]|uniref:Fe2OG dioxygenase domain-containing protein n=1 Tax=Litchfieldella qijiaojingensis TaxID=980347 RepID=A0ABQ2ZAN3_9GAMM|nr:hypothetical protein [Halomonas qijiaojingensis]GGY06535.1 hypothetical protein GCM10007160_37620 [Halomonas qijiaojingensis]
MLCYDKVVRAGAIDDVLRDEVELNKIREDIVKGCIYIFNSGIDKLLLERIRKYLISLGKNSLPVYYSIHEGCPNFHRVNHWDPRSHVRGCFHQFSFFPWNDDIFKFFELFKNVFYLKNRLSGLPETSFLSSVPEDGCVARLSFQYYPVGGGALNKHKDPVDYHQLTVPTMLLCQKGVDFHKGGAYVMNHLDEKIYIDELSDWGEVTYFNAQMVHGVDKIDPDAEHCWEEFKGRWIALFAVNKLASSNRISNSIDLGS